MNLKNSLTILLIDDNSIDRRTFRRDLVITPDCQHNIIEAESGTEGLTLYNYWQPDLIFLDYQLPDMNGLKFLRKLRKLTQKIFPPVIMLLEPDNTAIEIEAIKAGARGYLDKRQIISEELQLMLVVTLLFSTSQGREDNCFPLQA